MLRISRFPLFCSSSLFLLLVCFAVTPAKASTIIIYSTFGDDNISDYSTTSSDFVNVSGSSYGYSAIATPFTPTADYDALSVDVLLSYAGAPITGDKVDVAIYSDSSDEPGTSLEATPSAITVTASLSDPAVYSANITSTVLVAGTQYWLVVSPVSRGTGVAWFYNSTNCACADYSTNTKAPPAAPIWNPVDDESQLYFDVRGIETGLGPGNTGGSGVPEPGTLALLGSGLGAIALKRRSRTV